MSKQESGDLTKLIDYLEIKLGMVDRKANIVFIKGNHDNYLMRLKAIRRVDVRDYLILGDFCFLHGDRDFTETCDKRVKCWIMGHLHPAVKIEDVKGVRVEKYKCFFEGEFKEKRIIILPSFNPCVEGSDPRDMEMDIPWKFNFDEFDVLVVGEGLEVLNFGKLKNL